MRTINLRRGSVGKPRSIGIFQVYGLDDEMGAFYIIPAYYYHLVEKKTSIFLQLLRETAMKFGEANAVEWTEVDIERRRIIVNQPEKGSNHRIFKVTTKLIEMLNALPREKQRVFKGKRSSRQKTFYIQRRRTADKLKNTRLLKISFHTFRHWKATTLYHQTKDIIYVQRFLGHRKIENTMLYSQLADTIFQESNDEFTVRVATDPKEIKSLLEVGYKYICRKDDLMYFRKRK